MINENIPAAASETWNKAETMERLGGDEELFRELVQIFVNESPKLVQKLREAVATSNAESVMRAAHSIKGELSCLGAVAPAETAHKLETMGRDQRLAAASETFNHLERELQAFQTRLVGSTSARR